jgi:hypothetical protein
MLSKHSPGRICRSFSDKDLAGLRAQVARLSAAVDSGEAQARALREGQARL